MHFCKNVYVLYGLYCFLEGTYGSAMGRMILSYKDLSISLYLAQSRIIYV